MTTTLSTLNNTKLPAHLQRYAGKGAATDLTKGADSGFPIISIKGSKFSIQAGGQTALVKTPEGYASPFIDLVIVSANPNLSKIFYSKAYAEGDDDAPTCSSASGERPDVGVPSPQHENCSQCPHNVWGSKITPQGTKTKACADVRRIAVLAANDLPCVYYQSPFLLRVPAASLKELAAFGRQLGDVPYFAAVVRVTFDGEAAYPKLNFTGVRYLEEDELAHVDRWMNDPIVGRITGVDTAIAQDAAPPADPPAAPPATPPAAFSAAPPATPPATPPTAPPTAPPAKTDDWIPEHLRPAVAALGGPTAPAALAMLAGAGVTIPNPDEPEVDPMSLVPEHFHAAVAALGGIDNPAAIKMLKAAGVVVGVKEAKQRTRRRSSKAASAAPAAPPPQAPAAPAAFTTQVAPAAPTAAAFTPRDALTGTAQAAPAAPLDTSSLLGDLDALLDGAELSTQELDA